MTTDQASDTGGKENRRLSVLLLADDCNPEWPSLPVVAYKYALALGEVADVTIATHIRNEPNIVRARPGDARFVYLDNEWIAAPLHKFSSWLRGDAELAWSISVMMRYLPYLAFERAVWSHFGSKIRSGGFDIVHRISPMTPTLPSPLAGRGAAKFVLGPLNGNLDWPDAFRAEQSREKERLRGLRDLYKLLPYAKRTQRRSDLVLAAFPHTMKDLAHVGPDRMVDFPEIGFDPEIFHAQNRRAPFSEGARFLYAGRLVPYKLPEAVIRAFAGNDALAQATLSIVGDGPEKPRLEAITKELGLEDRVAFEGRKSQSEVAQTMRESDALVFPSIRELGAGIVIEAMACGLPCIVADYGAPGFLCANGRGYAVPLAPMDEMVGSLQSRMAKCLSDPEAVATVARNAQAYAEGNFTWARKAIHTDNLYRDLLAGRAVSTEHLFT